MAKVTVQEMAGFEVAIFHGYESDSAAALLSEAAAYTTRRGDLILWGLDLQRDATGSYLTLFLKSDACSDAGEAG